MKDLFYGISAGLLIGIGGTVFLSCESRVIGAVFFAVALICICAKGYSLYTGKIGFMAYSHKASDFKNLALCLAGNLVGTLLSGLAVRCALPAVGEKAEALCAAKLAQELPAAFVRALFCGILMYLAVAVYREKNTFIGILFCVPVFILSGFEHSVANMYYFSAAGMVSLSVLGYLAVIVLGNSVGGLLLPLLSFAAGEKAVSGKSSPPASPLKQTTPTEVMTHAR